MAAFAFLSPKMIPRFGNAVFWFRKRPALFLCHDSKTFLLPVAKFSVPNRVSSGSAPNAA
jgi:hypothetical protein